MLVAANEAAVEAGTCFFFFFAALLVSTAEPLHATITKEFNG